MAVSGRGRGGGSTPHLAQPIKRSGARPPGVPSISQQKRIDGNVLACITACMHKQHGLSQSHVVSILCEIPSQVVCYHAVIKCQHDCAAYTPASCAEKWQLLCIQLPELADECRAVSGDRAAAEPVRALQTNNFSASLLLQEVHVLSHIRNTRVNDVLVIPLIN